MALPLKLNAFERYMLADDRPEYPLTFTVQLPFSGRLDRAALDWAKDAALERHPLLHARVEGSSQRNWTWVASPDAKPSIDYADEGVPMRYTDGQYIDLRREDGLRIWVRHGADRGEICMQFHHGCCDGVGANQFVEDVLCAYDDRIRPGDAGPRWRPVDVEQLKHRARFGINWWQRLLRLPLDIGAVLLGLPMFFLVKPVELYLPGEPSEEEADERTVLKYFTHTFDEDQLGRLIAAARESKTPLVAMLICEVMLAIHTWNTLHDERLRKRAIRIMIALDLRTQQDYDVLPAANVVGMANLDRSHRWFKHPGRLLRSLKLEIGLLKWLRLAINFVRGAQFLSLVPGAMGWMSRMKRSFATCVVSNMGQIFAAARLPRQGGKMTAGELTIESSIGAPPLRYGTNAAFIFATYAGKLTMIMSCHRRHMARKATADFFHRLVRQIENRVTDSAQPDNIP